jgi:hypothetical protein
MQDALEIQKIADGDGEDAAGAGGAKRNDNTQGDKSDDDAMDLVIEENHNVINDSKDRERGNSNGNDAAGASGKAALGGAAGRMLKNVGALGGTGKTTIRNANPAASSSSSSSSKPSSSSSKPQTGKLNSRSAGQPGGPKKCFQFHTYGRCSFGQKCVYSHDGISQDEIQKLQRQWKVESLEDVDIADGSKNIASGHAFLAGLRAKREAKERMERAKARAERLGEEFDESEYVTRETNNERENQADLGSNVRIGGGGGGKRKASGGGTLHFHSRKKAAPRDELEEDEAGDASAGRPVFSKRGNFRKASDNRDLREDAAKGDAAAAASGASGSGASSSSAANPNVTVNNSASSEQVTRNVSGGGGNTRIPQATSKKKRTRMACAMDDSDDDDL